MKRATKRKVLFLLGLTVWLTVIWVLWWSPVIYPVKLFVVLLHEVGHAAAAVATGGVVQRIVVTPDQGGVCYCPGGNAFLTLSAGYLGSLVFGALILLLARARRPAPRDSTTLIGAAVLVLTALLVRNPFGILFGALFGGAMVALRSAGRPVHVLVLTALGLTSCLYALLDIKSDVLDRPYLESDARMLAQLTGVPTAVWGVLWIVLGGLVSWWLFRRALAEA
ncbi:MAG TPA: M50 family metallopeptidase [Longimicrobiales bacterium]|nr:M50 family metallopeptidase [Longimicrobiales bacterium]